MRYEKYRKRLGVKVNDREWPSKEFEQPPIWCSVDLRDGNQALRVPMNIEEKLRMFKLLVFIGVKEIEVGFPAASNTEYKFIRKLIDDDIIPDDVTIQVFTQCTENSVIKTFEALKGAKKAIVHIYNSTSPIQRDIVLKKSKKEIIDMAVYGANLVKEYSEKYPGTEYVFQYSPEYFIDTEVEYAKEVCEAVLDVWKPSPENKVIINLPATVEMEMPNLFADRIEWFSKNIKNRDSIILSLHTHNDRGTCIASTEMALLAGAERVEGTLFGNGERTGNLDIINLALNYFIQGINPRLNLQNIEYIEKEFEACTKMKVDCRHPYAGSLVFTSFSGSHQDAIRKVLKHKEIVGEEYWNVPYIPIDPSDIGREYTEIIRINGQSGKSGIAYVLENKFNIKLNRAISIDFGKIVKEKSDLLEVEFTPKELYELFVANYVNIDTPNKLISFESDYNLEKDSVKVQLIVSLDNKKKSLYGVGIDEVHAALNALDKPSYKVEFLEDGKLENNDIGDCISYLQISNNDNKYIGVGISESSTKSRLKALISAINKID